jgi:tetratricopeptide (TPR) repeat protein
MGDCYFAQYEYKIALQFYNEALEYGDCESQISFGEVFDANATSDEMSMHNQLVSKSAEAHISMQQYQNAVHYLEQAHDNFHSLHIPVLHYRTVKQFCIHTEQNNSLLKFVILS